MMHKTKAALQSCQCHYEIFKQSQHTRISAGGQSLTRVQICILVDNPLSLWQSSKLSFVSKSLIIPSVLTLRTGAGGQNLTQLNFEGTDFIQLFCKAFSHPGRNKSCSLLPQMLFAVKQDFKRKAATIKTAAKMIIFFIAHPFGSMPRCCSSLRMMRFIQAASDSSPSCCWACSISSRNSGSSLNWNGGLPRLSFLCVDTSITPDVMCLCVVTHYIHVLQIATPRSAGTLTRRLTKPLSEVTVMADNQSTQTRPKYQYRFLALNRHDKKAKPCRLSVEAATEREARSILAPHFILSLAARLPAREVSHA